MELVIGRLKRLEGIFVLKGTDQCISWSGERRTSAVALVRGCCVYVSDSRSFKNSANFFVNM